MKVHYIGCNSRTGVSEKTGRPYTIAEVIYMLPDAPAEKKSDDNQLIWTYQAYGNKVRTVPLDASRISTFADVKPCSVVDLALEPIPENPSRNHVTGVL